MKKNAVWIDCSTVNPSFSIECHHLAGKHNIRFMDAPVAGTKPQAEKAELVFFTGGDASLLNEVDPLLKCMGNKIIPMGEIGKGSSFKMLVNSMLAQSMLIFAETVTLGEQMGFTSSFLFKSLPELPVSAPFLKPKAERLNAGNYETQFPLEHMYKDLRLVNETGKEYNRVLSMAQLAMNIYEKAKASGLGREDFAAIYKYVLREESSSN